MSSKCTYPDCHDKNAPYNMYQRNEDGPKIWYPALCDFHEQLIALRNGKINQKEIDECVDDCDSCPKKKYCTRSYDKHVDRTMDGRGRKGK